LIGLFRIPGVTIYDGVWFLDRIYFRASGQLDSSGAYPSPRGVPLDGKIGALSWRMPNHHIR
jgi:hypothetical protein